MKKCIVCGDKAEYMWYGDAFCEKCISEALGLSSEKTRCESCGKALEKDCLYCAENKSFYCCKACAFTDNNVISTIDAI